MSLLRGGIKIRRATFLDADCGKFLRRFNAAMCLLAGDVLQLPVPVRGVDLLPDPGPAPEGLRGWDPAHVHAKGNTCFGFVCLFVFVLLAFFSELLRCSSGQRCCRESKFF